MYVVGVPLTLMVLGVVARTAVSPLGRRDGSWSKSVIGCCPSAASSALTALMFVSRRVSPARSISRSVSAPARRRSDCRPAGAPCRPARGSGHSWGSCWPPSHSTISMLPVQVRRQGIDWRRSRPRPRCGKPCPESGQYRGVGACGSVKVGKVKFVGRLPVVNARGAEAVPSFRTSLMRYVVLGSMPATMKLVLSPGTMGSGAVSCQDRVGAQLG